MSNVFFASALSVSLALLAGCATDPSRPIMPAPDFLAPWTIALRDSQPEGAYAAAYKVNDARLVFAAVEHENAEDSPTFALIGDAYRAFDFDVVIVEGSAFSNGFNSPSLIAYARDSKSVGGFQQGGETVPAVLGAIEDGAALLGGEPDDRDLRDRLLQQDFTAEDILGYYVLRSIPQWIREREADGAVDRDLRELIDAQLARSRGDLGFKTEVLPDYANWASWYQATNGKPFGVDFALEETGPLADGRFGSNKIAAAISRARDGFLHELIIDQINREKSVFVVYGGSHYLIHRPALERAIGAPCYSGPSLMQAELNCSKGRAVSRPRRPGAE